MENQYRVSDEGDPRRYYVQIPNLIDDMNLSVYAFRLYVHLKRVAGDNGICWQSTATMAEACSMSAGSIKKAKDELSEAGLIRVTVQKGLHGEFDRHNITIKDVWAKNMARYSSCSPGEQERSCGEQVPSSGEQEHSPHEQDRSPGELKNNPIKNNPGKKNPPRKTRERGEPEKPLSLPVPVKNAEEDSGPVKILSEITGQQYDPALQALIAQALGEAPDLERLQAAALAWKAHGYKMRNLDGILEWYRQGIPGRSGALGEPLRDAAYYGLAEAGSSGPEEPEELEADEPEMPRPQPVPPPPDPALDKAFPGYNDRPSGMTPRRAWQAARNQLQMEIPKAAFETFVRQADLLAFDWDAGLFTVGVPTDYARDWLSSRLTSTIVRLLTGLSARMVDVKFVVQELQPA